jgi:hypothetical protein
MMRFFGVFVARSLDWRRECPGGFGSRIHLIGGWALFLGFKKQRTYRMPGDARNMTFGVWLKNL